MNFSSSGGQTVSNELMMQFNETDLPAPVDPAINRCGSTVRSSMTGFPYGSIPRFNGNSIPAFFAGIFMALCYSISYGIATGFIFYCIVKLIKGESKDINPVLWVATILFILNFILLAVKF